MKIDIILILVGLVSGIINSIAGGGGILIFPTLLAAGLPAIIANATSSLVVWPGALTSAYGYRNYIKKIPRYYLLLLVPCFFGSIIGSFTLVHTSNTFFEKLTPWLVVIAVVLLALQPTIHKQMAKRSKKSKNKHSIRTVIIVSLLVFPLAIYGGYFGVGYGIMMLAFLGFTSLTNIHQMNGVKNVGGACIAIISTVFFVRAGLINWHAGLFMLSGCAIGGILGSKIALKISATTVHNITVIAGCIVAIYLLVKSYH